MRQHASAYGTLPVGKWHFRRSLTRCCPKIYLASIPLYCFFFIVLRDSIASLKEGVLNK